MEIQTELSPLARVRYFDRFPALTNLFAAIDQTVSRSAVEPHQNGTDLHFLNYLDGKPNRGRLRIFFPSEDKCVLVFYKRSNFNQDRFSYGGVVVDAYNQRYDANDIREWVEFLYQGLSPKYRPQSIHKSIPFRIPED